MLDVARYSCHVGQECSAGEDDWIIADEAAENEEEGVKIEEEAVARFATLLQDLEGQISDQSGSVNGDGNVGERDEEDHDVDGIDVVRSDCAIVYFLATYSQDCEEEEICY